MMSEHQTTSFAIGNNQTYEQKIFQEKKCVLETIIKIDPFRFPSKPFYAETPITNSRTLSNSNLLSFSRVATLFWASRKKFRQCVAQSILYDFQAALNKMKCVGRKKFGCDLGGGLRMGQWGRNCPTIYGFWADDDAHSTTQTPAAAD